MSWFRDYPLTLFQKLCMNIIKCGPIPKHVAFIMDGNRRYAKKANFEKFKGHSKGFDKLTETLHWCSELGIKEVTVYAFSIENFKRSKEEVDALLKLAEEKFEQLLEEEEKLMENGVCIRILGNIGLLSPRLRKLLAKTMLLTKDNNNAFLNVAFAYTSHDEMLTAIQTIVNAAHKEVIEVGDIDEELISLCLFTNKSPDPEIVIRTSGEVRFSNFLLWQISESFVWFTDVLWPEFSIWNLLSCIFKYQIFYEQSGIKSQKCVLNERVLQFLKNLEEERLTQLKSYEREEVTES